MGDKFSSSLRGKIEKEKKDMGNFEKIVNI